LKLLDRMNPTVEELTAAAEEPAAASGFKAKLQTEEAQQIYAPRSRIAESRMRGSRNAAACDNFVSVRHRVVGEN